MVGTPDLDTVLDVCGHKHRRIVLAKLTEQQQSITINDLTNAIIKHNHHMPPTETDAETVKQIHIGLHQAHLPKLADAGLIEYDPELKLVESTANVEGGESNVSEILAMDSDLPPA